MDKLTGAIVKIVVFPGKSLWLMVALVDSQAKAHVHAYGLQNTEVPKIYMCDLSSSIH